MLKGIPNVLSPSLLKILCEMGHGDRIVIADGNFPVCSVGKNAEVIRADGHGVCEILEAILTLMPLDTYVEKSVKLMQVVPGDPVETPIWEEYAQIIKRVGGCDRGVIGEVERMAFYEEARTAYAIVATSESALYANVMLQKGVIDAN